MKKLLLPLAVLSTTLIVPASHAADAGSVTEMLCQYVSADDKKRMRSLLKSNSLKVRNIFDSVQCNGKNLLEFAVTSDASAIGSLIIRKLPKDVVKSNMTVVQAGGNSDLIQAAEERVAS